MSRIQRFYSSLVGKKIIAAVTGTLLFLFLIGHMSGNLKAFMPVSPDKPPALDIYGHFLRIMGEPLVPHSFLLWIARLGLLASVVLHVVTVIQLSLVSKAARPIAYRSYTHRAASSAAKTMMYTGSAISLFIVLHLAHLTMGWLGFLGEFEHGKVYANVYHSFSQFPVAFVYVLFMAAVGYHLFHGVWSLFQTLGLDNPDRNKYLRLGAMVFAIVLFVGFSAVPLAFSFGWLPEPPTYDSNLLGGGH
jgi:succinate dehydrogenase / fumarate reductase, cytochrome b subunit